MKIFKRILLLISLAILLVVMINYPKLNIIAGYAAKNTASSVFVADRSLDFTNKTDNNFSPVNLASNAVDASKKVATSSVFGLLTRKAIYREGLGAVLTLTDAIENIPFLKPKRAISDEKAPFPYGNAEPKDTILSEIDYQKLNETVISVFGKNNSRAVLVIYKDQIIAEKYAKGFDKTSKILGWSMTKSITSTIFGILQYQKKLDVYDKAPIKSWQNDGRKNITIHNLLQMNSGLEWDENYDEISDVTKMLFLENDMTKAQENKPLSGKINASWNYSSGTTNLLSGIIRNQFTTQQEYLDFWYTNLIDKIGMNSMLLETDLAGNYIGSSYAWATARDWAKFGLLYLYKGNWNGQQLFDENWVDYVSTPTPTSDGTYGAQFWLNAKPSFQDVPKNMFYADGYQGQRVYILPDQDLVIVRMGLSWMDENAFLSGIISSIKK
ncbi:serine hydrolase domain-containing protein [Polaribacter sp.]|uniref:serine hydrolase domain-containing protein n=1 Tax=Polaribacter sp. TaxID=1920175 RepID=UPI0040488F33